MKRLFLPVLLLLCAPLSATVTKYSWQGTIDTGADPSQVSGSFLFDDSAPVVSEDELGGYHVLGGAISKLDLIMGPDTFTRYTQTWEAYVASDGSFAGFQDANLDGRIGNAHGWTGDRWYITLYELQPDGWFDLHEVSGKVVSFWTSGGYVPEIPGGDAEPVPEPSAFVLVGVALLAFAGFKLRRPSRPPQTNRSR